MKRNLALLLFSILTFSVTKGQDTIYVDLPSLVQDCTKSNIDSNRWQMAVWLPTLYWSILDEQMENSTNDYENIFEAMSPYMMFCIVDYSVVDGKVQYRKASDIRKTLKYTDSSNTVLSPEYDNQISLYLRRMLNNAAPEVAKYFGKYGAGMRIFLFKVNFGFHPVSMDLTRKNWFTLTWDQTRILWILPLPSISP